MPRWRQRLGESFKQVADRLEQVHKGLGEMQGLARDVGCSQPRAHQCEDAWRLRRGATCWPARTGVHARAVRHQRRPRCRAAATGWSSRIRLPGQRHDGAPLWLPIDAKFPREDYERLLDAQERADAAAIEVAAKAIETRLRSRHEPSARSTWRRPTPPISRILFVPTEGLYAEALRRPGLVESLQRDHKVMLAGPTTLLATLNSLQMGFRTLALERRSVEVWEVLGAVKTEFAKFGEVLAKTKKKLDEASSTIEQAQTRSNVMTRRLKSVEALPEPREAQLCRIAERGRRRPGALTSST